MGFNLNIGETAEKKNWLGREKRLGRNLGRGKEAKSLGKGDDFGLERKENAPLW